MPSLTRKQKLALGSAVAIGAAVAWQQIASRRVRRRQLLLGEIRPLTRMWVKAGEWYIHARVGLPPRPPHSPPIVLIHGFGVSGAYFIPTAERLARYFMVYAPDLPGHGLSDTPTEPLDIPRLTDALIAWMDATHIESACLIGNSMGCQIAVDAALRYPDRVDRLVLIGLTTDPEARSLGQLLKRFLTTGLFERPSLNFVMAKDYRRMGKRLLSELQFMRWDPIEAKLPDLEVPTMLVRGENDRLVPQRWLEEAAQLIGTGHIAVVPHAAHAVNYSAPDDLIATVTPFLMGTPLRGKPIAVGESDGLRT